MPKAKRSEAGALIAYFSMKPIEECESMLAIIQELMRARRREGKPKTARKKKEQQVAALEPDEAERLQSLVSEWENVQKESLSPPTSVPRVVSESGN